MREIKFRVWTGAAMEHKIMAGFLGAFFVQGMDEHDSACMSEFNTKYTEASPVMQFTGLKDDSGKEVFEGDFFIGEGGYELTEGENEHNEPQKVIFRDGAYFGKCSCCGEETLIGELDLHKVIGNIYENPDLDGKK